MANEEVLRLRTTVVSDEALANIRAIGREIGLMPAKTKPAITQTNSLLSTLTTTVKNLGGELSKLTPGLSGFGLGAAGAGAAAAVLVSTLTRISGKIVELQYASKELGMSERDLRAWSAAAEKAGIAPEAMMSGLKNFAQTMNEFKYNMGAGFDELVSRGAGPVVQRMKQAGTEAEKLKIAFDFKDSLERADPSGFKARRFFELIGLGADAARLSYSEFSKEFDKKKPMSQQDIDNAKKFHDAILDLGRAWDGLLTKTGVAMFPSLTKAIEGMSTLLDKINAIDSAWDKWARGPSGKGTVLGKIIPGYDEQPNVNPRSGYRSPRVPEGPPAPDGTFLSPRNVNPRAGGGRRASGGPVHSGLPYLVGELGPELMVPHSSGNIVPNGGGTSEATRAIKEGVFQALVDFKSYVEAGGSQGSGGGFMNASFGGSAGAAAGGGAGGRSGGWGGGGYSNLTPGTGGGTAPPGTGANTGSDGGPKTYEPGTGKVIPGTDSGGHATPMQRRGDSAGMTVPAGSPIQRTGLATITTATGKKMQVDSRYAANFQGFINDYEKAGGVLGPNTGTEGLRPGNPSGHPAGWAMDVNQTGWGQRGGGKSLDPNVEDQLAQKWGLVSGHTWTGGRKGPDTGHFGVRSDEAARQALIRNGVSPEAATAQVKAGKSSTESNNANGKPIGGGADYLRQERAPYAAQLDANPELKQKLAGIAVAEHEGDETAVVESLYNRTVNVNADRARKGLKPLSIDQMINSGFYGTPRRAREKLAMLQRNPEYMKKILGKIDEAQSTNLVKGASDQGSGKDPNVGWGGGKITRDGETYNDFGGGGGHDFNRRMRERQQATIAEAERTKRIDRATDTAANGGTKAEGNVHLKVESNGTAAKTSASADGLWQKTTIQNYKQMQPTEKPNWGASPS